MSCAHHGSRVSGNCPACLLALGVVDIEPGTVLGGLVRKIHPDATVVNFAESDDLAAVEAALRA